MVTIHGNVLADALESKTPDMVVAFRGLILAEEGMTTLTAGLGKPCLDTNAIGKVKLTGWKSNLGTLVNVLSLSRRANRMTVIDAFGQKLHFPPHFDRWINIPQFTTLAWVFPMFVLFDCHPPA